MYTLTLTASARETTVCPLWVPVIAHPEQMGTLSSWQKYFNSSVGWVWHITGGQRASLAEMLVCLLKILEDACTF